MFTGTYPIGTAFHSFKKAQFQLQDPDPDPDSESGSRQAIPNPDPPGSGSESETLTGKFAFFGLKHDNHYLVVMPVIL